MIDRAASTAPHRASSSLRGIVQWVLAVAAVFAVVTVAMSFIAKRVPVGAPGTFGAAADDSAAATGSSYPAPDFRLATLDGGTLGPPDLAGKVVLIDFWATWCGPCRIQAKFFEQLHGELAGKGVEFLAIDVGEDPETVRSFVAKTPFPYPVLLDPDDTLSQRYQISGLPTVMIVNRQGQVTFMNTGVTPVQKLRKELTAAGA